MATTAFYVRRIGKAHTRMNSRAFMNVIKEEMRLLANETVETLQLPTETWSHDVEFKTHVQRNLDTIEFRVFTKDKIYKYLDKGTSIRWAKMSTDWKSKTTPNSLRAGIGAGYVALRGKKAFEKRNWPPQPGIEARNFTKVAYDMLKPEYRRRMRNAVRRAVTAMKNEHGGA